MGEFIAAKLYCIVLFMLCLACKPVDRAEIKNLSDGEITVIGHGGAGFLSWIYPFNPLPHNSLASVQKALRQGAQGIEVDVQISRDNVLILYHDGILQSKTTGQGCIPELPAEQVLNLPYDVGFPYDLFQNELVISLSRLIDNLLNLNEFPMLYLDLKTYNECNSRHIINRFDSYAYQIIRLLKNKNVLSERVIVLSNQVALLKKIRDFSDDGKLKLMYDAAEMKEGIAIAAQNQFYGVVINKDNLTINHSKKAHQQGLLVVAHGGKSHFGIRQAILKNPDVIQVNNIPVARFLLQE